MRTENPPYSGQTFGRSIPERLASVERGLSDHEKRCAERADVYETTINKLGEKIDIMAKAHSQAAKEQTRTLLGILLALVAWGGKELWTSRGAASVGAVGYVAASSQHPNK